MVQKTISLMLCAAGLSTSAALGFSTDPSSLARNFNTNSATTNAPIVVTATFTNGAGVALRGFCYSEQIPSGLKVTVLGLRLNGQSVTNYTFESGLDGDVYPGCTPYRWVLEQPTGFTENNPAPTNATIQIQYSITSPTVGNFNLQQFNWAGYNTANTNASFGYSESSDAQSVSFNAASPPAYPILTTSSSGINFSVAQGNSPANQLLGITNAGGGTLTWTAAADGAAPTWLAVSPTNGVGNGAVNVSVASASLAAGTYIKNITVTAVGTSNSPQTVTVTLAVTPPNQPPVANADSYSVAAGATLNVSAPGVLGNDTDADGNALNAVLVSGVAHGTFSLGANGAFIYTPATGYSGPDSFTYKANDGNADSGNATVNLTVTVSGSGTNHYDFTYADRATLLAGGWDFLARTASGATRNTEQTTGAVVDYNQVTHPGVLRIPADAGDLWAALNNTRNSLFRDIPTNWTSLRLKFSFAPTQNYQQAGLAVYQNDDNYVCVERIYNGGNKITCAREVGGTATVVTSASATATTNLYLRLDRNAATGTISAYYSLDGTSWVSVGSAVQTVNTPRVGIIADSSPGGYPNADFAWVEVIAPQSGPAPAVSLQTLSFSAVQGAVGAALPGSGKIEPLIVSPDGQVRLTLRALAGQTFVIQASTNLESWDDLGTVNILGESAEFVDMDATRYQCRYYRAKLFKPAATASDVQNPSVGK